MDAVEFLNQVNRICNGSQRCSECPLFYESGPMRCMANVVVYTSNDFDTSVLVERVEKWAKEHPPKTRQSEFLKMFPNAVLINGVVIFAPCNVDKTLGGDSCAKTTCEECSRKYWTEEIE